MSSDPDLEVIGGEFRAPDDHTPSFLFVHGTCSSADMWSPWIRRLHGSGVPARALSLRGHGRSAGDLDQTTFDDYIGDVTSVLAADPSPTVLVGHSMGGFVVQHIVATLAPTSVVAAVLVAPAPPRGMRADTFRMMRRRPLAFARASRHRDIRLIYSGGGLVDLLLYPGAPDGLEQTVRASIGPESWQAASEMNTRTVPVPRDPRIPVLTMSGSLDRMVSPQHSRQTAAAWKGPYLELPSRGHMLPVEPGWELACDLMLAWTRQTSNEVLDRGSRGAV
jgi:pimeloyl-ACP methyl ester carboxylesterase